jgi:hypothetical protein
MVLSQDAILYKNLSFFAIVKRHRFGKGKLGHIVFEIICEFQIFVLEGVSAEEIMIDYCSDVKHFIKHIVFSALFIVNLLINESIVLFVKQKERIPKLP